MYRKHFQLALLYCFLLFCFLFNNSSLNDWPAEIAWPWFRGPPWPTYNHTASFTEDSENKKRGGEIVSKSCLHKVHGRPVSRGFFSVAIRASWGLMTVSRLHEVKAISVIILSHYLAFYISFSPESTVEVWCTIKEEYPQLSGGKKNIKYSLLQPPIWGNKKSQRLETEAGVCEPAAVFH